MNTVIKVLAIAWLVICSIFVWFGCMIIGFASLFTSLAFIYHVTPLIGLTCVICIIRTIMSVYKSDPVGYVNDKIKTLQ